MLKFTPVVLQRGQNVKVYVDSMDMLSIYLGLPSIDRGKIFMTSQFTKISASKTITCWLEQDITRCFDAE